VNRGGSGRGTQVGGAFFVSAEDWPSTLCFFSRGGGLEFPWLILVSPTTSARLPCVLLELRSPKSVPIIKKSNQPLTQADPLRWAIFSLTVTPEDHRPTPSVLLAHGSGYAHEWLRWKGEFYISPLRVYKRPLPVRASPGETCVFSDEGAGGWVGLDFLPFSRGSPEGARVVFGAERADTKPTCELRHPSSASTTSPPPALPEKALLTTQRDPRRGVKPSTHIDCSTQRITGLLSMWVRTSE